MIFDIFKKKKFMDRCAYCGVYTEIKEWYGGYGKYSKIKIGSPCCYKCDKANNIEWDAEFIEEEKQKLKNPPNNKQKEWIKKRDKLLDGEVK